MIAIYGKLSLVLVGFLFLQTIASTSEVDYSKLGTLGILAIAVGALWRTNEKKDKIIQDHFQSNVASMTKAVIEQTVATRALTDTLTTHLDVLSKMHEENRARLDGIKELLHDYWKAQ